MKKKSRWSDYAGNPSIKKLIRMSKITFILFFVSLLQVSAATYAQMTKLNLKLNNVTLVEVFEKIEAQSEFRFFYDNSQVDLNQKVSVDMTDRKIESILDDVFKNTNITYEVMDRHILVTNKGTGSSVVKQDVTRVSGMVTGSVDKQPIPGVTVLVKGTTTGTITDQDGKYNLVIPTGGKVLVFSFIGMTPEEIQIGSQSVINVMMRENIVGVDEVVVIGYGTTSKKDITGSVSTVSVKDALSVSTVSVSNIIQGRTSGVNVSSRSAQPGGGVKIEIRGATSPKGSNNPLIVIDGVPMSSQISDPGLRGPLGFGGGVDRDYLSSINPSDIESISILKDASSTAIYGSAAANGVVLVTTKKGKAGNVSVAYSGSYSVQNAKDYYPILDATSFMQQANRLSFERYLYDNHKAPYGIDPYTTGYTDLYSATNIANAGAGTNWLDLLLRKGTIQEHNISITGGTEKVKTFTSFNYYDNKGLLKNSDFRRYTARFNVDYEATPWLNIGSNFSYSGSGANNSSTNQAGGPEGVNEIVCAMQFPPNVPYDPNTFDIGMHSPFDPQLANPISFLSVKDYSNSSRIFVTPHLELKILPNLKFKIQTGYDASSFERNVYYPVAIKSAVVPNGLSNNGLNKNYNFSSEEYFTYDTKIGSNQNFNFVLGVGYYKSGSSGFNVAAQGFFTDAFGYNNIGIATDLPNTSFSSYKYENTKLSQFGRFNYTINNKYIVTLTTRRDGTSSFAQGKKYGIFPGAAVAWKIGEEQIIKNLSFISDLKLRVGYGATGNESMVGNFPLSLYGSAYSININGKIENGVALTQIGNPNITWETVIMSNFGLDFGFLNNRFSGTFDLYNKTSKDLLDYDILPYNSSIGSIASNVGSTQANGFDFNLTSKILTGKFRWSNDINISKVEVNWKQRNPKQPLSPWVKEKDNLYAIYGWKTDGLIKSLNDIPSYMPDATVGNIKYIDINNDGKLDEKDIVNLGQFLPPWNIGMNNTFNFKNFDLSVFVYAKFGNKRFDGYKGTNQFNDYYTTHRIYYARKYNTSIFVKDVWTHDNPNGIYPGVADDKYVGLNPLTGSSGNASASNNDFYLQNGAFLRIKNITLGYQLPESMIQKTRFIKAIRVYFDMDNIAVFTKWKGLDPEIQETNPYPTAFTTSFGVNVNF